MYGRELAYVALVVDDVEAASGVWEKNFGLRRSEHHMDGRKVPVLSVGKSAIALFGKGDPYTGGEMRTGVHHIALAVDDPEAAMHAVDKAGVRAESGKAEAALDNGKRYLLSMKATDGIRTYLSKRLDRPEAASGFIERIDHLGVVGTNNNQAIEVFVTLWAVNSGANNSTPKCRLLQSILSTKRKTAPRHTCVRVRPSSSPQCMTCSLEREIANSKLSRC